MTHTGSIQHLFDEPLPEHAGVLVATEGAEFENQAQTNQVFSEKWVRYSKEEDLEQERLFAFQKSWYLALYGFESEQDLASFLKKQDVVLDAGCGLGYKAKWFASLAPSTRVIGMDFSEAAFVAARKYAGADNLFFVHGDIARTRMRPGSVSYVSCDQVIHHTEDPQATMREFSRILAPGGELAVYVYAKKALPRELLDEHFRSASKDISSKDMWEMSEQLTELGKRLSDLNVQIDVPDIPLLNIKGGKMDIQRFIYWNFLKCFWNPELGRATSVSTNYDWYAPSNAQRYSQEEFLAMTRACGLDVVTLHSEEACHSGRFLKPGG